MVTLRAYRPDDLPMVIDLSLRAWGPVFESMRTVLGVEIFDRIYPEGVEVQRQVVSDACADPEVTVFVAVDDQEVVGFSAVRMDEDASTGELYLVAVDPGAAGRGVGGMLTDHGVELCRSSGMRLVYVGTGGDPGHAAARAVYERAGFTALPGMHYYRAL